MIDPKELRIGNIVGYDDLWYVVSSIIEPIELETTHRIGFENSSLRKAARHIQPIPLTEEWLLRFGFSGSTPHESPYFYSYAVGASTLRINPDNGVVWIVASNGGLFNNPKLIEHVHQLQNLYFALTGQELTIKTPEHATQETK